MKRKHDQEKGAILIMVVLIMSFAMLMMAFALDIGWILSTKAEMQHAADASALAAVWGIPKEDVTPEQLATQYSAYHKAGDDASLQSIDADITVGYMANPLDVYAEIDTGSSEPPNSVEVTLRRDGTPGTNSPLNLILGAFTNLDTVNLTAKARAAISFQVFGFDEPPPPGEESPSPDTDSGMIPFSFSETLWDDGIENGDDQYTLDGSGNPVFGSDGIPEIVIYPIRSTAGNWGTVDIGPSNNSTADIRRQIAYGISQADFDAIGGSMALTDGYIPNPNYDGTNPQEPANRPYKDLNGDTGISLGFKDAILGSKGKNGKYPGIMGLPRVILIHAPPVTGNGNNAQYKIVGFENVRIMAFNTRGANSELIVQPVYPGSGGSSGDGSFVGDGGVFSPDVPPSDTLFLLALTR